METTNLEPGTRAFIDQLGAQGGPPIYTLSPEQARKVLEDAQAMPVAKLRVDIRDLEIPGGPFQKVSVRIVRPPGALGPHPVILYCHGGGWILGSKETHDRLIRELAVGAHAALVFVNYTLAPEAKYPAQLQEAYAVAEWIAEGNDPSLDPSRVALVGDSVGGNMCAALALAAKQRGGPKFLYQVLFYPVTDANFDDATYRQFADGPWLTREAMKWFWNAYLPDEEVRAEPTASPLRASKEELAGLPRTLIIVDENDVLRDEGEAFAHRLADAGVPVIASRYLGTIHDFVMLNGVADTPPTRGAIREVCGVLKDAFVMASGGSGPV